MAPKSTEVTRTWGSYGTRRNTNSTTDGVTNTNTLYSFGSAAHPAAYYCKSLTTGGYNTWYLPAITELLSCVSYRTITPFYTNNFFIESGNVYPSSTEGDGQYYMGYIMSSNGSNSTSSGPYAKKSRNVSVRATRRSAV